MYTLLRTANQVEQQLLQDFEMVKGHIVDTTEIIWYTDEGQQAVTALSGRPVRIITYLDCPEMFEGWLDPRWEVEIVNPEDKPLDWGWGWIYGLSRNIDGRFEHGSVVLTELEY